MKRLISIIMVMMVATQALALDKVEVNVKVNIDAPPPTPTGLRASLSSDGQEITVEWDQASDSDGDWAGYYLYYGYTSGNLDLKKNITDITTTSYIFDVGSIGSSKSGNSPSSLIFSSGSPASLNCSTSICIFDSASFNFFRFSWLLFIRPFFSSWPNAVIFLK